MKKVCVLLLVQVLVFGTACYGAVSEDMGVYVRKDVFEVYMQNINEKLDMILKEQKAQRNDINELTRTVSLLTGRIDGLDTRMGDQQNYIYLVLVILGIIVSLPTVQKMLQGRADHKPPFTLEDVKRLIEENNVKVLGKPQV